MIIALVATAETRTDAINAITKKYKLSDSTRVTHEFTGMSDGEVVSLIGDVKLFGNPEVHIVHVGKEKSEIDRAVSILKNVSESSDTWVFIFEKLLKKEKDLLTKAKIEIIESKASPEKPSDEVFSIVRAYERGGKKDLWLAYEKLIRSGVDANQISGILFWKLKQTKEVNRLRDLVTLIHESRSEGANIRVRLEHFLLSLA